MPSTPDIGLDTANAIERVRELSPTENTLAAANVVLSAIPYAGGPLAAILSEYRGRRYANRIFGTLEALHKALQECKTPIETVLNEDQVVEIVYETLEEIAKISSEDKVRYLNNSLVRAFTDNKIDYPSKQHYLSVLKLLTLAELDLLRVVYFQGDPFVSTYPKRPSDSDVPVWNNPNLVVLPLMTYETEYRDSDDGESLRTVLQARMSKYTSGILEGLIGSLDAKNLSNIRENLGRRTIRIDRELPAHGPSNVYVNRQQTYVLASTERPLQSTPIEASRTEFGRDFLDYIRTT